MVTHSSQDKESTNQTGSITLAASNFTEIEFSIQAASGATTSGDYCFRLYNATGSSALNSYTYAQARVLGVTAIRLSSFTARTNGEGVAIQWKTGYEVDNLGFHIYREENGEPFRVTPELIAGSAFLTGTGTPLTAGRSYVWFDSSLGALNAEHRTPNVSLSTQHPALSTLKYYLEDWDLSGKKTLHGPVTPVYSNKPLLKYGNAALLSDLGKRQNQKYEEFWRIQEIREKLQQAASPRLKTGPAGLEDHPASRDSRTGPAKRDLEAVASNLEPQATPQAERSLSVSGSAQRAIASQPGIKIGIREQGWYRVSQPELVAAGLDPGVDPRRLRLFETERNWPSWSPEKRMVVSMQRLDRVLRSRAGYSFH